ncbi:MAG: glycine betaine ABC transporter substrate-binding protein [Pseudomonadota bacterium]
MKAGHRIAALAIMVLADVWAGLYKPVQADEPIIVGVPHWASAEVTAHILAETARDRFQIDARTKQSGTLGIFKGIEAGEIDVHPEIWLPNLDLLIERYAVEAGILRMSPRGVPASQNICTTPQTQAATGLTKLADLTNPEIARQFDTNGDGLGEIWIGAPSWSSTPIERIRARSYGYDQTMELLQAPEDIAMANVDAAVAIGRPVVFYCYQPHHIFQLHDIVRLEEPEHDPARWSIKLPGDDASWLKNSRADTAWDAAHFHIGYAARIAQRHPDLARFLDNVSFEPDDITAMAYAVSVERRAPRDVALQWIEDNGARIDGWMQ